MNPFVLSLGLGVACLGISACADESEQETANAVSSAESTTPDVASTESGTTAATAFPAGSRIVVEDGVTFRIDADGTRVRLGSGDSQIVVRDDIRYRVDPDGTQVRIGPDGAAIEVDAGDTSVAVNTN